MVKNNFPKSVFQWRGPIVPLREVLIKDDSHVFQEIRGALFSDLVDPCQNINTHFQTRTGFSLLHEVFGYGEGMKHHTLASTGNVWKQPVFNGIVL